MGVATSDACCATRDDYPEEGPDHPKRPESPRQRWSLEQAFQLGKEGQEESFIQKAPLIKDVANVRDAILKLNHGTPSIPDGICIVKVQKEQAIVFYCVYASGKRDEARALFGREGSGLRIVGVNSGQAQIGAKQVDKLRTPKSRRGGVQLSSELVLEGLKSQFNAMDKLEDIVHTPSFREYGTTNDIEFIRILKPSQFKDFLQIHGVPVRDWGNSKLKTKSLEELWAEVSLRECTLVKVPSTLGNGFTLERVVSVIFLEIQCRVGEERRYLLLQDEKTQFAARSNLKTRPSKKMFDDEEVEEAVWRCIFQNLDIKDKKAQQQFRILTVEARVEEKNSSGGFPGLPTTYNMNIARLEVIDPSHADMAKLGLPSGKNFQTTARFIRHKTTRTWAWFTAEDFENAIALTAGHVLQRSPSKELNL